MLNAIKKNKEFKHTLLLTTLPQRYGHMDGVPKVEDTHNYRIVRFYTPEHDNKFFKQIIAYVYFMIGALKYAYKNRKYYDCIFATSSRLGTAILAFIVSKITRKFLFLDIRDIFSDNLHSLRIFQNLFGKMVVVFLSKIEYQIIKYSNWVNFVSPGFFSYSHIKKIDKKFHLFTNGIDNIFINNHLKNTVKRKNQIKKIKILYAGNIGFGQGLELFVIPIAKYFNNKIQIQLIGDGSSKHIIKNKIRENNIKNIDLIPPINRSRLIEYYNATDIFLLQLNDIPAFQRVLPSKIFDYGSFNKPIIAGVKGVARNFMQEHLPQTFFYDPQHIDPIIKYINSILENGLPLINNETFIKKFSRNNIMDSMLESIIKTNKEYLRCLY